MNVIISETILNWMHILPTNYIPYLSFHSKTFSALLQFGGNLPVRVWTLNKKTKLS